MFVARVFPEFAITPDEAKQLADAICNYLRHTKIKVDPKTRDLWALILCVMMVEGTRALAVAQRLTGEKLAKKRQQNGQFGGVVPAARDEQGNVFPFGGASPGA
jgi:hypothetical protein